MSTVSISAADVNKLRQMTGAGMMDCKKALTEANGNFDEAIDFLRKKGQKVAGNRADREANEGVVFARTNADSTRAVLVTLNCETDFVAKNQEFIDMVSKLTDLALNSKPADLESFKSLPFQATTVRDEITTLVGKIGEKMELQYEQIDAPFVIAYNHPGNRLATIVGFNKKVSDIEAIAKDVAMQTAAMAPVAVDKDDVDARTLERELDIAKEQARAEGKPEEMVEKIALGKLNKFYKESTLLNQEFIKDSKLSVRQYLQNADKDLTVTAFKRQAIGS
jgi:elongation factor Ts